jgi:hypothetical protein
LQFGLLDPCAKTLKEGQACVGNIIAVNAKFTDVFMVRVCTPFSQA